MKPKHWNAISAGHARTTHFSMSKPLDGLIPALFHRPSILINIFFSKYLQDFHIQRRPRHANGKSLVVIWHANDFTRTSQSRLFYTFYRSPSRPTTSLHSLMRKLIPTRCSEGIGRQHWTANSYIKNTRWVECTQRNLPWPLRCRQTAGTG